MAVYTIALSIGFMLAFPLIGAIVLANGWRTAWWIVGLALLVGLAPLALLLVRRSPESAICGLSGFEITICDLKDSVSSLVRRNIKSSGNRLLLRVTC